MIDGKEGLYAVFGHVDYKGEPAQFDTAKLSTDLPKSSEGSLQDHRLRHEEFPDRGAQPRAAHRHDEDA